MCLVCVVLVHRLPTVPIIAGELVIMAQAVLSAVELLVKLLGLEVVVVVPAADMK